MRLTLGKLRMSAFWSLDALRGGEIRKAYQTLKKLETEDSDSDYVKSYRASALENLLNHATRTTSFYQGKEWKSITDFPVMNKNVINEHKNDFLSSTFMGKKLYTMSTSGSTGVPFICIQDQGKKKHLQAEVIHYSEKAGYAVGENLICMRSLSPETTKSRLKQFVENETLINARNLEDPDIDGILERMRRASRNGSMVLGYGSTMDTLKDYFKRNGIREVKDVRINGMICCAEILFDDTRQVMADAFKCSIYSRYSNMENGIIGQDLYEKNVYLLNEGSYYVEFLKMDSDEPAEPGEPGRIVLTDLFNYAMPLIRYDTGDIGERTKVLVDGVWKDAITNFCGRRIDQIFDSTGKRLRPGVLESHLSRFEELRQFHVIQESETRYTIEINVLEPFHEEQKFQAAMEEFFGPRAEINLVKVSGIPLLGSGKRKYFENRMLKQAMTKHVAENSGQKEEQVLP